MAMKNAHNTKSNTNQTQAPAEGEKMSKETAITFIGAMWNYAKNFVSGIWTIIKNATQATFNVPTGLFAFGLGIITAILVGFTGFTLFVGTCAYAGIGLVAAFAVNTAIQIAASIWNFFSPEKTFSQATGLDGIMTGLGEEVSIFGQPARAAA
jgi:hypothetical protein